METVKSLKKLTKASIRMLSEWDKWLCVDDTFPTVGLLESMEVVIELAQYINKKEGLGLRVPRLVKLERI